MTSLIARREFITLLGAAAAAWPLAARAQQPGKLPTIGFLARSRLRRGIWTAFVQRLRELGWIEGRPSRSSFAGQRVAASAYRDRDRVRPAEGRCHRYGRDRMSCSEAGDLGHPDRVRGGDPVGIGLVADLARPGGNITGLSIQETDTAGKRVELLRELSRSLRRLAIMANVGNPALVLEIERGSGRRPHARPRGTRWKSGEPRISRPPWRRSRDARMHFMSVPTRS